MRTHVLPRFVSSCQDDLYSGLNEFSKLHPNWGRVCAIPISVVDGVLEVLKNPLGAIESAILVPINLVGTALSLCKFDNSCALKDSLICAEWALEDVAATPVAIFMAAPKLAFQFSSIVIDPKAAKSVSDLSIMGSSARAICRKNQNILYSSLNHFSASHPNWGRVCAIPVSTSDVALDMLSVPLAAIEFAALAAIHLIGAVLSLGYTFENSYTLGDSLAFAEAALRGAVSTPVAIFMAAPKLAFQFSASVIDPETVKSIVFYQPTYYSKFDLPFLPLID